MTLKLISGTIKLIGEVGFGNFNAVPKGIGGMKEGILFLKIVAISFKGKYILERESDQSLASIS